MCVIRCFTLVYASSRNISVTWSPPLGAPQPGLRVGEKRVSAGHFKTTPSTTLDAADKHWWLILTRHRVCLEKSGGWQVEAAHRRRSGSLRSIHNKVSVVVTGPAFWGFKIYVTAALLQRFLNGLIREFSLPEIGASLTVLTFQQACVTGKQLQHSVLWLTVCCFAFETLIIRSKLV